MKNSIHRPVLILCLVSLLTGCLGSERFVVTEPIGPRVPTTIKISGRGYLLVYSAWDGFDALDSDHEKHSAYAVYSEQGTLVSRVRNRTGSFEGDPTVVSLPVGTYKVEARATNFGLVSLRVVLRENETTVVYLDGTTKPPGAEMPNKDLIKLPNGQILGWKAQAGSR